MSSYTQNNYLTVEKTYADNPWQNTNEVMKASEVAELYPNLADIITHPDFSRLSYTIELTKVEISWKADHRDYDGQPAKEYEGTIPVPF